ncbi:MAG TPA: nucleotidyltransferase family protein, partial [bacterium]|nr:nucleotidyltransferase family protein [bacterium]
MTRKSLTAIIPAAGLGTRLRPLTYSRPKALLPLAGKPMIGYVLEAVRELGASRVVLIVGHLAGQVAQYVKENFTSGVVLVEQKQFLGLGHAIFQAAGSVEDEALIFLGDTLVEGDFTRHIGAGYSWLAVKEVEDPRPFGVVVTDRAGWIRNLVEKPATPVSRKAIVGVYYLRNSRLLFQCLSDLVTGDIRTRGEYQLTDAIQMMVQRG